MAAGMFDDGSFHHHSMRPPAVVHAEKTRGQRAAGSILGMAIGDALGAPHEFDPDPHVTLTGCVTDMPGGRGWEPGEWTDDTAMAIPLLEALAAGRDLTDDTTLDTVVSRWLQWRRVTKDIGIQTDSVLGHLRGAADASAARTKAYVVHERTGRSGGNGSLMRIAPVGLAYVTDQDGASKTADAARATSALTHFDPTAADACVLWAVAIRSAVRGKGVDLRDGLAYVPEERRAYWEQVIAEGASGTRNTHGSNGWVFAAFEDALVAMHRAGLDPADTASHTPEAFRLTLEHAINLGHDTDTVAAIAGSLAGALVGIQGIPLSWQRRLHGWGDFDGNPLRAQDLVRLSQLALSGGVADARGWLADDRVDYSEWGRTDVLARHPHDDGVWIGGVGALDALPADVDAVVSLCQVGSDQVPGVIATDDRVEVWLLDEEAAWKNPHLDGLLVDAADVVAELRAQGKTVLLHCVQAESRTPAVAGLYSLRYRGVADAGAAFDDIASALGVTGEMPRNATLRSAVERAAVERIAQAGGAK